MTMADQTNNQPPIKKFRIGNVSASVWERQTERATFNDVSFQRFYVDKDGQPQSSNSFGLADIGALKLTVEMAEKFLAKLETEKQA
jgi:hypothetical protein